LPAFLKEEVDGCQVDGRGWQPCLAEIARASSMSSTEKRHTMHADLVRPGGLRLDRVAVDVLEELEATVAVWRLEHREVGVVAVKADGGVVHSPLTVSRPRTVSPRSVKKAIAASRSRTAMPTFSSLMRTRSTVRATRSGP
jgi:hypothetical protein